MNVIETQGLTKTYSRRRVVDNLNMCVRKGDIYGFVGKNGSGKSTTMKMICGLATPTAGDVVLFGGDAPASGKTRAANAEGAVESTPAESAGMQRPSTGTSPAAALKNARLTGSFASDAQGPQGHPRIGVLIEAPGLLGNLSAYQNLMAKALASGIVDASQQCSQLLATVGLDPSSRKKVSSYSLGMRQRLGLAMALVGSPDVLLLDEPFNGLDPEGVRDIRNLIMRLNEVLGTTVLISSHVLDQLDRMATRYGVIAQGRLVREMTAEQVRAECKDSLRVRTADPARAVAILQDKAPELTLHVEPDGSIVIANVRDASATARLLQDSGQLILELVMHQRDIEEYFLSLMNGGERHV